MPIKNDSTSRPDDRPAWFDASWDPEVPLTPAENLDPRAQAVMQPGETLLWTEKPSRDPDLCERSLSPESASDATLAVAIAVLLLFLCLNIADHELGWALSPLDVTAMGALGAGILWAIALGIRSTARLVREAGCVYAITDRRVLRVRGGAGRSCYEIDPFSVEVTVRDDGTGSISFASGRRSSGRRPPSGRVVLLGVPHARQVDRLLLASLIRRAIEAGPLPEHPNKGTSRAIARCIRAHDGKQHAAALAMMLQEDADQQDGVVARAGTGVPLVQALGIVGVWRPIGVAGARAMVGGFPGKPEEMRAVRQAITRIGRDAAMSFIDAWVKPHREDRTRMLWVLDQIAPDVLADAVGTVLLSENGADAVEITRVEVVRRAGTRVIDGWVGMGSDAISPLIALAKGANERAGFWAAEALGKLAADGRAEQIRAALGIGAEPDDVPQAALLAYLGDPAGMQALARTLGEGDDEAIRVVADALGQLGAPAAPALDALLEAADATNDGETRSHCRRAIKAIQDALDLAPAELEAASAPAGTGTEPEAALPPEGTGTEMEAATRPRQR